MPATIPSYEFPLYQLDENGSTTDLTCPQPFNVALYSRYKYGSTVAADWFARALGSSFLAQQPFILDCAKNAGLLDDAGFAQLSRFYQDPRNYAWAG